MPWDEELEELTMRVFDTLGEAALTEAVARATVRALNFRFNGSSEAMMWGTVLRVVPSQTNQSHQSIPFIHS